jgi:hypothetical protein
MNTTLRFDSLFEGYVGQFRVTLLILIFGFGGLTYSLGQTACAPSYTFYNCGGKSDSSLLRTIPTAGTWTAPPADGSFSPFLRIILTIFLFVLSALGFSMSQPKTACLPNYALYNSGYASDRNNLDKEHLVGVWKNSGNDKPFVVRIAATPATETERGTAPTELNKRVVTHYNLQVNAGQTINIMAVSIHCSSNLWFDDCFPNQDNVQIISNY